MNRFIFLSIILFSFNISWCQVHTLNSFIDVTKNNSPLLNDYRNQVLANKLDSAILRASLRTQLNFLSTNSYAPVIKGYGYDEAITNIANVSALMQASRTFISRGNLGAQLMSIALAGRALNDTIHLAERDILKTVTEQYITAFEDQTRVDFNKEVFDLMKKEDPVLKKLTERSVYKQTDYLNFYITLQQQEYTYLQSIIQYNTDYLTLNYLAGVVDTSIYRIEEPTIDTVQLNFTNSFISQKFITDSLRIIQQRKLIAFEYKPKTGAYADAGYYSSLQIMPYRNFGVSAGVSLIIPLYDGNQKRMKLAKTDLQEKTRVSNKDFYYNQFLQQSALLRQQVNEITNLTEKIQQQIRYANTLITANGRLLETGDITIKDYVLSLGNYLTARNTLIQNNVNRLRLLSQISYLNR